MQKGIIKLELSHYNTLSAFTPPPPSPPANNIFPPVPAPLLTVEAKIKEEEADRGRVAYFNEHSDE
jgi:hypothetical protein